jgi:hypothetical protein
METKTQEHKPAVLKTQCPYCGEKSPINAPNDYKTFYALCLHCKEKFVVEPIRDGINVYTLTQVPYNVDPDCQALERGQSDEE